MNALVTGAAGFIGSHLCESLLKRNLGVIGVDNLSLGKKDNIKHLSDNTLFHFKEIDLTDYQRTVKIFEEYKIDIVFHLAANSDIRKGTIKTDTDLKSNLITTYNVLEGMRLNSVSKILFSSTSAVYGRVNGEIIEDHGPLFPTSLYGASKLAAEAYISAYCNLYGFKTWIVRFPNVIGSRLTHGVIFDFINKLKKNPEFLEILGDGRQRKPYVHVNDLIKSIIIIWENADEMINYYNIGVNDTTSVDEIASMVIEGMGLTQVKIEYTGGSQGWPGDIPHFKYNISKLKSLGGAPALSSNQSVKLSITELLGK